MFRLSIPSVCLLALAALPPAALCQNAAPPTDAPASAPAAAAGSDIEAFFLTQGAASPIEVLTLEGAPAGEYWIGVQLEPLPELIVSQLKLERGMVVVQVFEDSPAAKAEFKVNDIILRAGDKDVKGPQDLIAAVNEAKDKELAMVVLRGGSEATLNVTPVQRQPQLELGVSPETPHVRVVKALDELSKKAPHGDVRLLAVRPGGVFAYAAAAGAKLPSNLEVRIEKRGEEPAKIHVRRFQEGEDKTWEVTEDKLGDLPEDIRGHVQQMLGGQGEAAARVHLRLKDQMARAQGQAAQAQAKAQEAQQQMLREYRVQVQPQFRHPVPMPPMAVSPPIGGAPHPDHGIQAKLDAILKKLDQPQGEVLERLQKEVEQLRKELEELRQDKK